MIPILYHSRRHQNNDSHFGFSNPSYFSKQFKTIMGSRPREYRAASHKEISTY
ncbi:hypothetical protein ROSEINA2194_00862 [Roseburia inulinivorans DSM 16841]|uniref:HTH araC/xylS-type domain-containing protein n=1 Tax=Roseburia inulinivorans DSM 16841 TaxID=622312 RepID=C0FQ58_9FIRM|nr:hypothetical protein ROSEINA2194_00862 [Roseburia inulinivorans DSM 16841]